MAIRKFLQLKSLSVLLCKTMAKTSVTEIKYLGCGNTLSTPRAVPLLIMIVMIEFDLFLFQYRKARTAPVPMTNDHTTLSP